MTVGVSLGSSETASTATSAALAEDKVELGSCSSMISEGGEPGGESGGWLWVGELEVGQLETIVVLLAEVGISELPRACGERVATSFGM